MIHHTVTYVQALGQSHRVTKAKNKYLELSSKPLLENMTSHKTWLLSQRYEHMNVYSYIFKDRRFAFFCILLHSYKNDIMIQCTILGRMFC